MTSRSRSPSPVRSNQDIRPPSKTRSSSRSISPHSKSHDKKRSHSKDRGSRSIDRSRSRDYKRSRSRDNRRSRSRDYRSRSRSRNNRRSPSKSNDRYYRKKDYGRRSIREDPEPSNVLGVFGLSYSTRKEDLQDIFSKFGEIDNINMIVDPQTNRSRGFGFIYFNTVKSATEANNELNGIEIHGRKIRTDFSITQRAHQPTPGRYMGKKIPRRDRDRDYGNRSRYDRDDRYDDRYDRDRYDDRYDRDRYDDRSRDRYDRDRYDDRSRDRYDRDRYR